MVLVQWLNNAFKDQHLIFSSCHLYCLGFLILNIITSQSQEGCYGSKHFILTFQGKKQLNKKKEKKVLSSTPFIPDQKFAEGEKASYLQKRTMLVKTI